MTGLAQICRRCRHAAWLMLLLPITAAASSPPRQPAALPSAPPCTAASLAGLGEGNFAKLKEARVYALQDLTNVPPGATWRIAGAHPALDLAASGSDCWPRTRHTRCSVPTVVKLQMCDGGPGILAGRSTRVTLLWTGLKEAHADMAALIQVNCHEKVNCHEAFDSLLPGQPSAAGRRLSVDVPADAVRDEGGLDIHATVAARIDGKLAYAGIRADAIELEIQP